MRILWLKTELLHPVDKGGRIRTYQMLRAINKRHPVTYLALDDGGAAPNARELAREYATHVETVPFSVTARGSVAFYSELLQNLASPLPYSVARYRSEVFSQRVRALVSAGNIDLVVCDFLSQWVNVPRKLGVPVVLFQHNVEAEIWRRHAEVAGNPLSRWFFGNQFRRTEQFERQACSAATHVVAVSEHDASIFRGRYGVQSVSAVPTGVDVEYFNPAGFAERVPGKLIFTGSMDWMPNVDGVTWFAQEIWPRVRAARPDATFVIVGRNPPAAVRALANLAMGVEVTGTVPDVRPYLASGSGFVVPLRVGGGTRLKIYEAMAMECPIVSTTIGAEGLPVHDGEHLRIADDVESFAAMCVNVLNDVSNAKTMATRAATLVRESFGWDAVADQFVELCAAACLPQPHSQPVN